MSLVSMLKSRGPSGFGGGSTAEEVTAGLSLAGKTILVTGCNSGLGLEAMRVFALRGARVIGTARTVEKAAAACGAIAGLTLPLACELSDPKSVRACVESVRQGGSKLDAIVCNAGIMALPERQQAFGTELQLFTNHVGHFLLVTGLLDRLADDGRVVAVASSAHRQAPKAGVELDNLSGARGYEPWKMYGQSKLANILFAKELARRFAGTKRVAIAIHPGVIKTGLSRYMNPVLDFLWGAVSPIFLKSVEQGAATEVYAAVHPDAAALGGSYLADCNVARPRPDAEDAALAKALWEATEKLADTL